MSSGANSQLLSVLMTIACVVAGDEIIQIPAFLADWFSV
jgi:hypothetical protein